MTEPVTLVIPVTMTIVKNVHVYNRDASSTTYTVSNVNSIADVQAAKKMIEAFEAKDALEQVATTLRERAEFRNPPQPLMQALETIAEGALRGFGETPSPEAAPQ